VSGDVEREGGNREVSPFWISEARGDLSGAGLGAYSGEEGGSWGKNGFPHTNEPEARKAA
jgi:hypothetical protein